MMLPEDEDRLLAEMSKGFEGIHRLVECDICRSEKGFTVTIPSGEYTADLEICGPCVRKFADFLTTAEHVLDPFEDEANMLPRHIVKKDKSNAN